MFNRLTKAISPANSTNPNPKQMSMNVNRNWPAIDFTVSLLGDNFMKNVITPPSMTFIWAIGFSQQLLHKNVNTIRCDSYMLINNAIMHGNSCAYSTFVKIYLCGIGGG